MSRSYFPPSHPLSMYREHKEYIVVRCARRLIGTGWFLSIYNEEAVGETGIRKRFLKSGYVLREKCEKLFVDVLVGDKRGVFALGC